jgi:hypothetical protein
MPPPASRLLGPLPQVGPWTRLALTRGQFVGILVGSIALFVLVGGPVWRHVHDGHFLRITVSYGVIPVAVAAALAYNRALRPSVFVGATVVIASVKLLATAGLLLAVAIAQAR